MSKDKPNDIQKKSLKEVEVKQYTAGSYRVVNKESIKLYNPNVVSVKKRIISA